MCSRILLQTPRHVTGAGGCNLPLSHMPAPVTPFACQRCERERPHCCWPPHDRRPWGRAFITCIVQSRLCAQTSGPRSGADPGDHAERGGTPNTLESDRRNGLEERHCDRSSHLQVLRRFCQTWPFFLSIPPASANRNAKFVCALVCAQRSEAYCG